MTTLSIPKISLAATISLSQRIADELGGLVWVHERDQTIFIAVPKGRLRAERRDSRCP